LVQLFRGEFIYPTEGLIANMEKTLQGLEKDEIIILRRDDSGKILTAEISDIERLRGRENYDFYCFLIWPFVESTWLGAISLFSLTPPSLEDKGVWLNFKQTQDTAQMVPLSSFTSKATLTISSWAKRSITRETSPTGKPSTKRPSKIPFNSSKKKALSS